MTSESNPVILTGATGFIGRWVLQSLVDAGHEVHCLINNREPAISSALIHTHSVNLLNTSRAGKDELNTIIREICKICDPVMLHLAWYTGHKDYLTSDLNIDWRQATKQLIDVYYAEGGKRFVGTGTCIEYDLSHSKPCVEDVTPEAPTWLYAKQKVETLDYLRNKASQEGLDWAWGRIFFNYGPGDEPTRLIPYIIRSVKEGNKATPRFGALKRDYLYVKDLGKVMHQIATSKVQGIVNAGSGKATEIQEIFNTVGDLLGHPELIERNHILSDTEPTLIEASMQKYQKEVGELHLTSWEAGLGECIRQM